MDLARQQLNVGQVAVETAADVTVRPYPKSRAAIRTIPLPNFLVRELEAHRELTVGDTNPDPKSLVFRTRNGTPQRWSNFRRQVWRPALVRAGLLGSVAAVGTPGALPGLTNPEQRSAGRSLPSGKRSHTLSCTQ